MIKRDKRKYSINIVSGSSRDTFYKHLDPKKSVKKSILDYIFKNTFPTGEEKALKEAQRLANRTGKKVTVLTSVYNVYPSDNSNG